MRGVRAMRGMRAIGKYKFLIIFSLEIVRFVIGFAAGNVLSIANIKPRWLTRWPCYFGREQSVFP